MDRESLITSFKKIDTLLINVRDEIKNDNWESISLDLKEVNKISDSIFKNPELKNFLDKADKKTNSEFSERRDQLFNNATEVNSLINKWKESNHLKVAESRNARDNISRFRKNTQNSYYIDQEE